MRALSTLATAVSRRVPGSLARYQELERLSARVVDLNGPEGTARVRVEMDPAQAENLRRQFRVEMRELANGLGLSEFDVEGVLQSFLPELDGPYELEVSRDGQTTVQADHVDPTTRTLFRTWSQRALPFAGPIAIPGASLATAPQRAEAPEPVQPLTPEMPVVPAPPPTGPVEVVWIPAPGADDSAQTQMHEQFQRAARILTESGPDLLKRYVALEEAHSIVERPDEPGEIARVRISSFPAERAGLETALWILLAKHLDAKTIGELRELNFALAVLPFGDRPCTVHVFERDGRFVHSTRGAGWTRQGDVDVLPAPFQRIVARARNRP